MTFPDPSTRLGMLEAMHASYCRKLLKECAISPATLARLRDPLYLPTQEEVLATFQLDSPPTSSVETDLELLLQIAKAPAASRSFSDNLRLEFGPLPLSPLAAFCKDEILTVEYADALAEHLASRLDAVPPTLRDTPVLALGAGAGRLSHFLSGRSGAPSIFFTDRTTDAAVAHHQPSVVLCWWMPANIDLTAAWRGTPSVHEYVLVGPADSSTAGLPWETWGFAR